MFLSLVSYFHSFFYPALYIKCSLCLCYVLKSKVAYKTCDDCKKKDEDKLAEKIMKQNEERANRNQAELDNFILNAESR